MVTTQFVKGKQSFGALTATLIATMGDAAFLLLAKKPLVGGAIFVLGFTVGWLFGLFVNKIHGADFLRPKNDGKNIDLLPAKPTIFVKRPIILDKIWLLLMIPAVILAGFIAFQYEFDATAQNLVVLFGLAGGALCWFMYMFVGQSEGDSAIEKGTQFSHQQSSHYHLSLRNFIDDTNFVTIWVILAFLLFEVSVHVFDIDLKNLFNTFAILVPLMAILIGFLPGCGPQILVATLYLQNFIPLSALLGNAISNDGDALFPALALTRKAALIATLYSAIPALIVGYGYYFVIENYWARSK